MMDELTRKRLEAAGWKFGTVAELLKLSPREAKLVEAKLKEHYDKTKSQGSSAGQRQESN